MTLRHVSLQVALPKALLGSGLANGRCFGVLLTSKASAALLRSRPRDLCGDREGHVSQAPLSSTVGSGTHILGEQAAEDYPAAKNSTWTSQSLEMMITRGRGPSGKAMAMNLMSMVAPSAPS